MTALAVGFNSEHRDERPRAVAVLAGRFWEGLGGSHEMTRKPLLIVHGMEDSLVPFELGEEVYRAAQPPKVLVALEGARHHEEIEDGSGPVPAAIGTALAFWDLFLRDDAGARSRLLAEHSDATVSSAGV